MNTKLNQMRFAAVAMMLTMAAPALAQSNNDTQKGAVNTVQLTSKSECAKGGMCGKKFEGRGRIGYKKFRGDRFSRIGMVRRHSMFAGLKGEYALTDVQREKILALKDQFRSEVQPKFVEIKADKRKIKELVTEPSVTQNQVLSVQAQINGDVAQVKNLKLENKLQQLSILTDAQRQQIRHEYLRRAVDFGRS